MEERTYIAIDLKSFYASVECMERGLDPLTTNLVVADPSRTEKTICLAVSPSLKTYGISGRARLFDVVEMVRRENVRRSFRAPGGKLSGESYDFNELAQAPEKAASYIVAPPRMSKYMEISAKIHEVYLKYVAPEDMHVYSIDEVFLDVTPYLGMYSLTPHDLAMKIILDVLSKTGITATAGIGSNLYLSKVAMDVMAKHIPADQNGVRIAALDEESYRRVLWTHEPLTDFWRVGRGYAAKLNKLGLYTMGDIALFSCSQAGEDVLYDQFGVNAELLIDHAWGWEPCTISHIKAYKPASNSLTSGQILSKPYTRDKARLIVREMGEQMALDLVGKCLVTNQLVLTIGYDTLNVQDGAFKGEVTMDRYGRKVPKHGHGTINLSHYTSSAKEILEALLSLYDRIVNPSFTIRRLNLVASHVVPQEKAPREEEIPEQMDLFTDYEKREKESKEKKRELEKEKKLQETQLLIQKRFGKNAILKGADLQEDATTRERNSQIGGHRA